MMMYNDSTLNGNDRFHGFLKELLDRLKKDLDFEYIIHEVSDKAYGVQQADGSWNGMLGELITKVSWDAFLCKSSLYYYFAFGVLSWLCVFRRFSSAYEVFFAFARSLLHFELLN